MSVSEEPPKQIQYLNIIRIAATLLVILHHCISPYVQSPEYLGRKIWWLWNGLNSLTSAAVPLFFMISGYLLLNNTKTLDFSKFYKRHVLRVFIPFIIWNLIYFVYKIFMNNEPLRVELIKKFFDEFINKGSYYHLWFVYTIIAVYLFAPFLKKIIDGCSLRQLLLLLILITFGTTIRPFINNTAHIYIYLFSPIANGYLGYFLLGYILGKYNIGKKMKILIFAGGVAGVLIGTVGNYLFASAGQDFAFNDAYALNNFLCAAAVFVFFKSVKRLENIKNPKTENLISYVSSITFGIYLSHVLVLDILRRIIHFTPIINVILRFSLTAAICFMAAAILSKIKYINRIIM